MSYQIPYHRETVRPVNDVIPGNTQSDNPVEFDIAPAWGADLARIKSVVFASMGLITEAGWTPELQAAVIGSFETGAAAFVNTVEAIRGLTVPAVMALRAGLISELPRRVPDGGTEPIQDPNAPIPITTGVAFSRICGAVSPMALHVAMKIADLSNRANMDPRFFAQPSGSGIPAMERQTGLTATSAPKRSRRRGTAGNTSRPATR